MLCLCTHCLLRAALYFKIAAVYWVPTMCRQCSVFHMIAIFKTSFGCSYFITDDSRVQRIKQITWIYTASEEMRQTGNICDPTLDTFLINFKATFRALWWWWKKFTIKVLSDSVLLISSYCSISPSTLWVDQLYANTLKWNLFHFFRHKSLW